MIKTWEELWNDNYRGIGDTAELDKLVKRLDYGSRTGVSYLPWAVVERIFKMQGGSINIVKFNPESIVEVDKAYVRDEINEAGVVIPKYMMSYFINVQVFWHERSYTERYPLQDSNGRPLSFWTQNDLNKACQRAKVKAIASVSGIGYKLFEDGDLQFENDEKDDAQKKLDNANKLKDASEGKPKVAKPEKPEPAKTPDVPVVVPAKLPESPKEDVSYTIDGKIIEKSESATPESRVDIENEVKRMFLTGDVNKSGKVRTYLSAQKTAKLQDLSDEQIRELYLLLK